MIDYISKMDAGALGTWVGSIGTVLSFIVLGFLASKQNSINKRQFLLSRSQLYIDSSIQLLELINNISNEVNEISIKTNGEAILGRLSKRINKIYFSSQLYLSNEITEFIKPVRETVLLMKYDYNNYLYEKSVIDDLSQNPDKLISCRREILMVDFQAFYDDGAGNSQKYSIIDIPSLEKNCNCKIQSIFGRKNFLLGNSLQSNYSPSKISKKYKTWITS